MVTPLTAFLAGMGTLAATLAVGLSTAVMLTEPARMQKHEPSAFQKRAEAKPDPAPAIEQALNAGTASPLITAIQTPKMSTAFSAPPAPWPRPVTQSSAHEPKLAPDPGVLQLPARPAPPFDAAARETLRDTDGVSSEERQKAREAYARKKRKQIADQARRAYAEGALETRPARGYAQQRRDQAPLGFFGLLFGGDSR